MTDALPEFDRRRAALASRMMPQALMATPQPRPRGPMRGILYGFAIVLPVYAAAAVLILLLWG